MNTHALINGETSIVITGGDELEKMILKMLAKSGEVVIKEIKPEDKFMLLDKIIPEGVVVTSKKKEP